ncbi:MAG: glycogen debranching N-terminal domain-containing protein [Ornithinimicrobium sp.]
MPQQPWLHDLQIAVDGPATVLTDMGGSMTSPASGWYVDDRRLVKELLVTADGMQPTAIASSASGNTADFWGAARHLGDPGPDPTVEVHQRLVVHGFIFTVEVTVVSRASEVVDTTLQLLVSADATDLSSIKGGLGASAAPVLNLSESVMWADGRHRIVMGHHPPATVVGDLSDTSEGAFHLRWPLRISPGTQATARVTFEATRTTPSAFDADAASSICDWTNLPIDGDDEWRMLIRTNLTDLQHLLQNDPLSPGDIFAAAGTPWYLTLFGRDAAWAARMMLPYSTQLAEGTLRALARRQATSADPHSAAEPGKMLHEVRRTAYVEGDLLLPTVYYGTVDATPLWIVLLHEAWEAGLSLNVVRELLPNLLTALDWMDQAVTKSPDGLLRYLDADGHGLSNQGWKDSGDSMRHANGSIAQAPIALIEAQAYAVQAARGATELLSALGEDSRVDWLAWAADLGERVRGRYWVDHPDGRYLAMALDADGRPVDGVGSNMGHALATGLLSEGEEAQVAERLMRPDMLRPFGIGTLSALNPAYNPTGYHTGSVWTHDSAIILRGLAAAGFVKEADRVSEALIRLGTRSDYRFPELVGGESVGNQPVPYPASCRPQAWAAASAAVLLRHRDNAMTHPGGAL